LIIDISLNNHISVFSQWMLRNLFLTFWLLLNLFFLSFRFLRCLSWGVGCRWSDLRSIDLGLLSLLACLWSCRCCDVRVFNRYLRKIYILINLIVFFSFSLSFVCSLSLLLHSILLSLSQQLLFFCKLTRRHLAY
jgi:hypothetical protein